MSVVRSVRVVVVLALFGACGCAGPRFVSIGPEGGTLALPSNTPYYHDQAVKMLAEKYPNGYVIDHEGEVVVGQVTTNDTNAQHVPFGRVVEHRTEVSDKTEWQIAFHPKGVQPAAPVVLAAASATTATRDSAGWLRRAAHARHSHTAEGAGAGWAVTDANQETAGGGDVSHDATPPPAVSFR